MKTLLLILTVALVISIALNRQRIYLRDPLAKVYVTDTQVEDIRVYINFSNDILLEHIGRPERTLVQHWNLKPGVPVKLTCLEMLACMTETEHPRLARVYPADPAAAATMTDRSARFYEERGLPVRVELR